MFAGPAPVRVLIVDDQQIFTDALRSLLERERRIEVVGTAGDGAAAIELALLHDADIVLMDISMPLMDGLEATRRLLSTHPSSRVLILSGLSTQGIEADALAAGASGFMLKGDLSELISKILEVALHPHH